MHASRHCGRGAPHGRSLSSSSATSSISDEAVNTQNNNPANVQYVKIDSSRQLESEFEFGRILGEGAFGQVLLAVRKPDGERFAVKKLPKNKDTKSTYGKSWENEIRVLRRFQHANIVQLEIIYESANNCYLFMELCDAGTLADELERRGRLQEADARCLLRQVGSALSFLHKSRIVHRDLKLQNCLLKTRRPVQKQHQQQQQQQKQTRRTRSYRSLREDDFAASCPFDVKLTDFGLSIELRCLEHSLADNVGTPVYQAPEIVNGSSYTYKCDIWALGIIAYSLLHGRCPYEEASPSDLVDAIRSFNYAEACASCEVCRQLSRECRDCLHRLLRPCQVERSSAAEFMDSAWSRGVSMSESESGGPDSILEMMRNMNKAKLG